VFRPKKDAPSIPYSWGAAFCKRRPNMTKKDIVLKVSDQTGIKQIDVKKIVQKTFDCIVEALVRGEKIELRNFGVFKVKQRKSRTGRNPRTNQVIPVPPRKVVVFKSGLAMKQQIR
jgi:nucleoid DNA-binding protein